MIRKLIKRILLIGILVFWFLSQVTASEIYKGLIYPEYSKVISMDFQNANLKDVLKIFSKQSGLNFVTSESVQDRKVTVYLDNVPVEQALDKLLTANNLAYDIDSESNVFIVRETGAPELKIITKVYFLKYASVSNSKLNRAIKSGVESGSKDSTSTTSSLGISSAATGAAGSAAAAGGIADIVKSILTGKGSVKEDQRTNSLTVTDVPSQFPIIDQTIAQLDIPTPQVMIEVEMLDVTKNAVDKVGIEWPEALAKLDVTGARVTDFPFWGNKANQDYYTFKDITSPSGKWKFSSLEGNNFAPSVLTIIGKELALNLFRQDKNTKYLARPRLLTLSNETAEIKIITQEAIGLLSTTQSVQSTATQTQQAERAETGVSLRVTPQINVDTSEITMYIEPKVSQAKTGGTFGTTTFKDPEERLTKSVLRIKDGETIVVGGLLRTDYDQTISKIPILGDIPLVGAVFRHRNMSKNEERELIVFITPRIVKDSVKDTATLQPTAMLSREQDKPAHRNKEIDKALEAFERKRR